MSHEVAVVWAEPDNTKIQVLDTGYLKCEEDSTYWCEHIHWIVNRQQEDMLWFWSSAFDHYRSGLDSPIIMVPVMPSKNLWARVTTEGEVLPGNTMILLPHLWVSNTLNDIELGALQNGEGRHVLRTMIFDWMEAMEFQWVCHSPAHGYREQAELRGNTAGNLRLAEQYSILAYGKCLACSNRSVGFDPADFAPEEEKARSWT